MQSTELGTRKGVYADHIDSFSEYIVRNSVIDRFRVGDPFRANMIKSAGYPENFDYTESGNSNYYSNRGVQAAVYTFLAVRLGVDLPMYSGEFFSAMRFVNCVILSSIVVVFFWSLTGGNWLSVLASVAFLQCTGLTLVAANLYFQIWIMCMPLFSYIFLVRGYNFLYVFMAFAFSVLYFSVRYEFATTFAFLWLLPVVLVSKNPGVPSVRVGIGAFLACCIGFVLAVFLHHLSVARELEVSYETASSFIFSNLDKRLTSLDGVPAPFTPGFFKFLAGRWSHTGWALPFVAEVKKAVFLIGIFLTIYFIPERRNVLLLVWGIMAYFSWYVFAYQHIMWHYLYDSILFSLTVQLSLAIVWLSEIMKRLVK